MNVDFIKRCYQHRTIQTYVIIHFQGQIEWTLWLLNYIVKQYWGYFLPYIIMGTFLNFFIFSSLCVLKLKCCWKCGFISLKAELCDNKICDLNIVKDLICLVMCLLFKNLIWELIALAQFWWMLSSACLSTMKGIPSLSLLSILPLWF